MHRGMLTLSFQALQRLNNWDISPDGQLGALPIELQNRVKYLGSEPVQQIEISVETAQQLLDILPPPHFPEIQTNPILLEISNACRAFVLHLNAD